MIAFGDQSLFVAKSVLSAVRLRRVLEWPYRLLAVDWLRIAPKRILIFTAGDRIQGMRPSGLWECRQEGGYVDWRKFTGGARRQALECTDVRIEQLLNSRFLSS